MNVIWFHLNEVVVPKSTTAYSHRLRDVKLKLKTYATDELRLSSSTRSRDANDGPSVKSSDVQTVLTQTPDLRDIVSVTKLSAPPT